MIIKTMIITNKDDDKLIHHNPLPVPNFLALQSQNAFPPFVQEPTLDGLAQERGEKQKACHFLHLQIPLPQSVLSDLRFTDSRNTYEHAIMCGWVGVGLPCLCVK